MLDSRDQERLVNTHAGAEMEERPRYTAHWDHQSDFLAEAMTTAWADPEIDACWKAVALKLHAALRSPVESGGTAPHVSPTETEIRAMFVPLISLLRERVPAFEYAWGSDLEPWIRGVTIQFVAPEIDIHIPEKWARFLPDNPLLLSHDPSTGKAILEGVETATWQHFEQIQSYFKSLAAPRKSGRLKGSPKPSKSGRRSVPPRAALRAYDMNSHGAHWREIAKALWPAMTPADLRSEKTRLKVRYYIERGDRLARK